MQVGNLVKHNGYGPVGWKMKGCIGMIIKHENWGTGGEWRVLWSTPVTEWYKDALFYSDELEVINESR